MMSRRRSFLSLGMIVLMLALPWTAVADASGRGNEDEVEKVKISTQKEVDQNRVEIEVEFENLTDYITYEYEINITRVDPDFAHQIFTGDFTTESGEEDHTITKYWEPDQDGAYTIRSSLIQYESVIATGTDTFEWGDVANNSDPANLVVIAEPLLTHYDIFGNESLEGNVTFHFSTIGTETGATYKSKWGLYVGDDDEFGGTGDPDYIVGEGPSNWGVRHVDMAGLTDWVNNTNYTIATSLYRVDESDGGGHTNVVVGSSSWKFAIGEEPEFTVQPVILGCTDANATNYDPAATEDDGTCTFLDSDGDGVYDHLEIDGCTNANATNFDPDATEEDGSCIFLDSDGDGVYDYLEIDGCTDDDALNHDEDATDDDGSCIYPDPLRVILTANQTTGDAPLSVTFFADISEGRTPYQISWDFDDGTFAENLTSIEHIFYTAGVYNVHLQVTGADGETLDRGIQIIATEPPVISNLTGYISHSGQLEPVNKGMAASVEFYGSANGGEGPYTFTWKFGDDTERTGSTIFHEFATAGEYTVELIIEDSAGRTLQLEETIIIVKGEEESGGLAPPPDEVGGVESDFDIYATSTGAIGLLLIFGLFGRKRRESFLDAERRRAQGEGSMWDQQ